MRIPGIFWSSPLVLGCLVAGCLVAGCLVAPQPRIATSESVSYPVKSYDDASGIRVVLEQSPDYGVASVVLSISAGSAQESPAKAGLAHLAEHLVFQGSHAETNLWNRIVELGGFGINGATDWDATRFWATVPTASAAKLVALFAEILRDPLKDVDQQGFESELKVVREEFHLRSENGAPGQAVGWLFPALFSPAHPYGHPIAGTPQSLEHLSLADVQSFVAEHYKVDLATIAISAPETTERESAWVASGFGGAPGVPHRQFAPGRSSDAAYARVNGGLQDHEAPIAAPALWIGWPVPRQQTPGGEVLALLPSLLQGAFAAERRVFDPRVVRIEPASFTGRQGAVLYIKLSLRDADSAESLVGTFINQLRSALTNLIYTPSWLDYVRQSAALESTYREENILTRTLNLANSTDLTDDPLFARKEAARLGGVTAEAASAYVGQYLQEETARAVLVTPTTKARSASLIEAGASGQPAGAVGPAGAPIDRRSSGSHALDPRACPGRPHHAAERPGDLGRQAAPVALPRSPAGLPRWTRAGEKSRGVRGGPLGAPPAGPARGPKRAPGQVRDPVRGHPLRLPGRWKRRREHAAASAAGARRLGELAAAAVHGSGRAL
jgi:predicted Zn-dependent peptidase